MITDQKTADNEHGTGDKKTTKKPQKTTKNTKNAQKTSRKHPNALKTPRKHPKNA
jgi:hypothetical protein